MEEFACFLLMLIAFVLIILVFLGFVGIEQNLVSRNNLT